MESRACAGLAPVLIIFPVVMTLLVLPMMLGGRAGVVATALFIGPESSAVVLTGLLAVYGVGLGLAPAQLTNTVLAGVPTDESGEGPATQSTVRQVGTAPGSAIAGSALSLALAVTVPRALRPA